MDVDFKKHTEELRAVLSTLDDFYVQIEKAIRHLHETFEAGHSVYVAGNGGSAAEAQHLTTEFSGRYKSNRRAYPMMALSADGTALTSIGNDFGFKHVFRRQIEAFGREGDVFIGLTTSGTSENILLAAQEARARGMSIISLTGTKGTLKDLADVAIIAPTETGARIQELHLHAVHLICEAFEEA